MDKLRPFDDPRVAAIFAAYPEVLRERLLRLRALIFESADDTKAVGPLIETVKWGQPSYVPQIPKAGTTVRIDALGKRPGHYAALFHCQTSLVSTFRALYPDLFEFEGNRALIFGENSELPRDALKHCFPWPSPITPGERQVGKRGMRTDDRSLPADVAQGRAASLLR